MEALFQTARTSDDGMLYFEQFVGGATVSDRLCVVVYGSLDLRQ